MFIFPMESHGVWNRDRYYAGTPRSTPATMSKQHCRMLQVERFFRQSQNNVQFDLTLPKGRNYTINSLDIVAVFGNKVECCFDIISDVDGA